MNSLGKSQKKIDPFHEVNERAGWLTQKILSEQEASCLLPDLEIPNRSQTKVYIIFQNEGDKLKISLATLLFKIDTQIHVK